MSPEREAEVRALLTTVGPPQHEDAIGDLLTHIDHMRTWPGLLETVRSHFPEDVFDGSSGDPGPLLLVALRDLGASKAALDAERKAHAETRREFPVLLQRVRDAEARNEVTGERPTLARLDAIERRERGIPQAHEMAEVFDEIRALRADRSAEKARADALEARLAALVESSRSLVDGWPEGGCVVEPRCGGCRWCRFYDRLSDLTAAAAAYRDRVRAEVLRDPPTVHELRHRGVVLDGFGEVPDAHSLRRLEGPQEDGDVISASALLVMASEKGGAK